MRLDALLTPRLEAQRNADLYRQRHCVASAAQPEQYAGGQALLNFCSNDYLGLAADPRIKEAFASAAGQWGFGSGASHLVSGHSEAHEALEHRLAEITQRERAVVFSTGYMANLGVITALAGNHHAVIGDKLNHASLIDACQLAAAKNKTCHFSRYRHLDMADLARRLKQSPANSLVVTDGVFSMDGDSAPLAEIAQLAEQSAAHVIVDDAHGFGVLGAAGGGSVLDASLSVLDIPVYMGTLGKAVGGFGAFVAGSEALIEALIQFARPYIYTTALPPAVAVANLKSLELIQCEPERHERLQANIQYFRHRCLALLHQGALTKSSQNPAPHLLSSSTAIQPLVLGAATRALKVASRLKAHGIWVGAIRPPTVPANTARLRITLSAAHTQTHIDQLCDALALALAEVA